MSDPRGPERDVELERLLRARVLASEANDALRAGKPPEEALATARRVAETRAAYLDALATWLRDDPTRDVAQLSAEYPIALLPVRIETRFGTHNGAPCLRVRMYPDEVTADSHEPELTEDERLAAERYWRESWDTADEREAWRALLTLYPAPRAAWIVRVTTPTNLTTRPAGQPVFPAVAPAATNWARAAEARVLPDRWIVTCYRARIAVRRAVTQPIPDPLPLTVSPALDPEDAASVSDISGDGLLMDKAILWTVDFAAAEALGMGVTLPLSQEDAAQGFDAVLVYGVRPSLTPEQGAERLQALLDAQHYSRGLAFVPQGTATNNTSDRPSGYPAPDPNGAASFAVERADPLATDGSDGAAFADALGVERATADHVAGTDRHEQGWAQAMNRALWPLTWGYFLDQLLDPLVPPATVDATCDFFVRWVRGRGPLPAFRVGSTPYGLLPVSSLARWQNRRDAAPVTRFLPGLLRQLLPYWQAQIPQIPHVGRGDPDQALLDILAEDASAREVWIRPLIGSDAADNLARYLEIPWEGRLTQQLTLANGLKQLWGGSDQLPRILGAVFHADTGRFRFPLVATPLSETAALDFNYLQWIRTASIDDLRFQRFPEGVARPTALLYRLARHGVLLEYRKASIDLLDRVGLLALNERREPELVGIVPGTEGRKSIWDRLAVPVPSVTGTTALGDHLQQAVRDLETPPERRLSAPVSRRRPVVGQSPESITLREQYVSLETLQSLPTAELDRLFSETLDCCAHRLDAWITALASERLAAMRSTRPDGVHLGGFGWVENLRPVAAPTSRALPNGTRAAVQQANGGFIHAPSMTQAATAAVLRNGYLTRSGAGQLRYALDVSSDRVRQARWLLSGMRHDQSLRALLGYQFERGLHERHVEQYIERFRELYPLPERDEPPPTVPTQGLSARDVVDGLRLREEFAANAIPFGSDPDLPNAGPDLSQVQAELAALDATVDAVSDVLTADAVHHLVRGTTMGAGASLDAQAQGVRPPDPEVVRFPRGGIPLTHRVALILGGDPIPDVWDAVAETPRSTTEPHIDRWLAALLGDPDKILCRVRFADPTPADPNHVTEVPVSCVKLGLRPLDLLSLARGLSLGDAPALLDPASGSALADGSELDRRAVMAATANASEPIQYEVLYSAEPNWPAVGLRSFPEIFELLRAAEELLGKARPLRPADLLPPEIDPATTAADSLDVEANGRGAAAVTSLDQVRSALQNEIAALPEPGPDDPEPDVDALRDALIEAVHYGAAQFPPLPRPDAKGERLRLISAAKSALTELERRVAAAAVATTATDKAQAVFGREFRFLPRFKPGAAGELQNAIDQGPTLVPGDAVKLQWIQQAMRVRQPLALWGRVAMYARCLGTRPAPFDLAQIPHEANAQWVALPFTPDRRPSARRTSLALYRASQPNAADPWVGLLLDEWNELIPATEETTGIAFHYDDPGAEAAQAILLAVPPTNEPAWDAASLEAILLETFELAKVRAVHADLPAEANVQGLPQLSQLLPAIYLAANPVEDTVSTDFAGTRVHQAQVLTLAQ